MKHHLTEPYEHNFDVQYCVIPTKYLFNVLGERSCATETLIQTLGCWIDYQALWTLACVLPQTKVALSDLWGYREGRPYDRLSMAAFIMGRGV